jgi:type II secretory pathway pseudopilin PulG
MPRQRQTSAERRAARSQAQAQWRQRLANRQGQEQQLGVQFINRGQVARVRPSGNRRQGSEESELQVPYNTIQLTNYS